MRTSHVPVAAFRLLVGAAVLVLLSACSLFGGSSEPSASDDDAEAPREAATAWQRADPNEVARGGTMRLAVATEPATYNPLLPAAAGTDLPRLLGPTTGSAVRTTSDGGWEVDPDYATRVEQTSDDPQTIRVELNRDAVWQNGDPITAADMAAFVDVMTTEDARVASRDGWDDIAEIRADGDFAYDVVFERPRGDWPAFVYPRVPRTISEDVGAFNEGYAEQALPSNGPFVVADIDEETGTITQEPNPRWWGRPPKLSSIEWRIAAPEVQAEAFVEGDLDVATLDESALGGDGANEIDAERIQRATGAEWTHLTLNAGRGPLRDDRVRRAVAAALDREALAEQTAEPLGATPRTVDSLVRVPEQAGYEDVAEPLERDLQQATSLLEEAGYTVQSGEGENGESDETPQATRDGDPLTLSLAIVQDSPALQARADAIAEQLAEAGITVDVRTVAAEDFSDGVLVPLDFDLLTFSWPAALYGPDATMARFRPITSPQNLTGASMSADPWRAAGSGSDDAIADLDEQLRSRAVMIPISLVPRVVAVGDGVVNVGASSFETPPWTRVGFRAED